MRRAGFTLALLAGCALPDPLDRVFGPDGRTLREEVAAFPEDKKADFELFLRRCSTCHPINEALSAHVPAGGWGMQVRTMQRKPGAAIPDADAERVAGILEHLEARRRAR